MPLDRGLGYPCTQVQAAASYNVGFEVLGGVGAHTYSWSVPAQAGVTVTVVLSQNGVAETLAAQTDIQPICGKMFC